MEIMGCCGKKSKGLSPKKASLIRKKSSNTGEYSSSKKSHQNGRRKSR